MDLHTSRHQPYLGGRLKACKENVIWNFIKLVFILIALYVFLLLNIVGGGGPILLVIAVVTIFRFVSSLNKRN